MISAINSSSISTFAVLRTGSNDRPGTSATPVTVRTASGGFVRELEFTTVVAGGGEVDVVYGADATQSMQYVFMGKVDRLRVTTVGALTGSETDSVTFSDIPAGSSLYEIAMADNGGPIVWTETTEDDVHAANFDGTDRTMAFEVADNLAAGSIIVQATGATGMAVVILLPV